MAQSSAATSGGGASFVPPPPPPAKATLKDGRLLAPASAPTADQARDRRGEPDRGEALRLRRRPQAVPPRLARPRLRLLGLGVARPPRRRLPALAAPERRADELGPQRARQLAHRLRAAAATPTSSSRASASTPRCTTPTRRAPRPARAGAARCAARTPSWRATRAATSAQPSRGSHPRAVSMSGMLRRSLAVVLAIRSPPSHTGASRSISTQPTSPRRSTTRTCR